MTNRPTDEDLKRILLSQGGPNLPAAPRERVKAMAEELLELRAGSSAVVKLGALSLHIGGADEALRFAEGLVRHLNAGEVSSLIGVSEKTIQRWRKDGALPPLDGRHQVSLLELLVTTAERIPGETVTGPPSHLDVTALVKAMRPPSRSGEG